MLTRDSFFEIWRCLWFEKDVPLVVPDAPEQLKTKSIFEIFTTEKYSEEITYNGHEHR